MTARRIALVTRRFWPLVGGAEMVMANLACEFRRQGDSVELLTAQWQHEWPTEVVHREIPVTRLPNPPHRGWGTLRYMLALNRWLRRHAHELDVVYVSMLKHDAYAAIHALSGSPVPVVLRAEGAGESGDCAWQKTARFGGRIRRTCQTADALIAPSAAIRDELLAAGYPAARTHFIPNGVAVGPPRSPDRRITARRTLAEANYDLSVSADDPIAVYTGRLHPAKGLFDLVKSWPTVLNRYPDARLWLVGDGPARDELFELILDLDLRGYVVMPGSFDDVQDLLYAADVFVLPSYEEGMSLSLLEAMAIGLPVVATDIPGNRALVEHRVHGLLVPVRSPTHLAQSIHEVWNQSELARQLGDAARQRVAQQFSLEACVAKHRELFAEWLAAKRGGRRP